MNNKQKLPEEKNPAFKPAFEKQKCPVLVKVSKYFTGTSPPYWNKVFNKGGK